LLTTKSFSILIGTGNTLIKMQKLKLRSSEKENAVGEYAFRTGCRLANRSCFGMIDLVLAGQVKMILEWPGRFGVRLAR
jgi:hypothetical protein